MARLAQEQGDLTAETVSCAADQGDVACQGIIRRAGHYLGVGLASYVNIFNPEAIIIGGGLAKAGELLLAPARAEMAARAMSEALKAVQLRPAELGDYAGVMGMVALLREGCG